MADIQIILFDSPSKQRKDGTFPISLRITHNRKRKYFSLGKYCNPQQWNKDKERFKKNYPNHRQENDALDTIYSKAKNILLDFEKFDLPFSFGAFKTKFLNREIDTNLYNYADYWIDKFMKEGKIGTASPYKTTKNAILEFTKNPDFKISDIHYKFLIEFEHWLRTERSCVDTSISVYMRTLRSLINKAIKEKAIKRDSYPFEEYKISERLKTETKKRAITNEMIRLIEAKDFPEHSKLKYAKDIFLFSYYCRGINFIDIAYLKPENISNGRLNYVRRKTGKPFSVKLIAKAKDIINYYLDNQFFEGDFIFPVFDTSRHITPKQMFDRKTTALRDVNRSLKELAQSLGFEHLNLTSYVSRHTYATIMKKAGKQTSLISEALGHGSEKVTEIYLKSFENTALDDADAEVL